MIHHALVLSLVALMLAACDGSRSISGRLATPSGDLVADGGSGAGDGAGERPGLVPDAADAGVGEEVGTFELPRVPADPKATLKLVPGSARLVGGEYASCTHAPHATTDRWCAFSLAAKDKTELWVLNMTRALAGPIPACDGTNPGCLRLSSNLWTGFGIYGAAHPSAHRFEGDTLIFHADATAEKKDPYEGAIWAWRPGWSTPRKLTSDHGTLCFGEHESPAVYCIDNALIDRDPAKPFDRPKLRAFDLCAGMLEPESTGPLPVATRITIASNENAWRARFTKSGSFLYFSTVPSADMPETLFAIKTSEIGKATPTPLASDVAEWKIAHDSQKVYFLRGYDRSQGSTAVGALMMADLPSGQNPVELQKQILTFSLLGAYEEVFTNVDRGLSIAYQGAADRPTPALLLDRNRPAELISFGTMADVVQTSNDTKQTLTLREIRGGFFPSAFVNHNDGTGLCRLTADYRAETYGLHFSDSSRLAFWIEYGRNESESEEGWYANPATCGDRSKFGDFVFWFAPIDDDFALFEGGDLADSTRWLQYTSLRPSTAGPQHPRIIQEQVDGVIGILRSAGSTWAVYAVGPMLDENGAMKMTDPNTMGLFVHGPLTHAR